MKKIFSILIAITILFGYGCGNRSNRNGKTLQEDLNGTISISGSSALYPLAQKWAEEFQKVYPNVRISVVASNESSGITDVLSGKINMGMLSRELSKEESDDGIRSSSVAKYAVVPIVNLNNPVLQEIMFHGLKRETLKDIFITGKNVNWSIASRKKKINEKMNVYKYSDNNIDADIWAKYLGGNQKDLIGTSVSGNASMVQAIKNDNNGIGFTSLGYVYDLKSRYENSGLRVLPIDINDNGVLDDREYFYQHMDSLVKAITDGRFTSTLTRSLYIVYKSKPMDNLVNAFLKWVLSDGQKFVLNEGFVTLPDSKIKTELNKL